MIRIRTILSTSLLLLAAVPALAEDAPGDGGGELSLWALMQQGGWAMYPLGACSIAMFFLIFHCVRETAKPRFVPDPALPRLDPLMESRDLLPAWEHLAASPSVLSRALGNALQKARPEAADANKAQVEASLSESLEHEENGVGQWINYLNVVCSFLPKNTTTDPLLSMPLFDRRSEG